MSRHPRTGRRPRYPAVAAGLVCLLAVPGLAPAPGYADPITPAAADATPPSTPGAPSATDRGLTGLTLTWAGSEDPESGIAGYDVIRISGGEASVVGTSEGNTATVTGLAADTTYTFAVVARNGAGLASAQSPTADLATPAAPVNPPTPPGTPVASGVTDIGLTLTWAPSTDNAAVAEYRVFAFGIRGAREVAAAGPTAEITGLSPSSQYQLAVVAVDDLGNVSDPSPTITVTTAAAGSVDRPPSVPGTPVASGITATSVTLTWAPSTDDEKVTGYDVLQIEGDTVDVFTSVSGPTATLTGLLPATRYTFAVRAEDATGNLSAASPSITVTTAAEGTVDTPPTAPGTPVASGVTATGVTLTWAPSTDDGKVTGYDVLRIEGSSASVVASVTTTTATVGGLNPNTAYTFAVVAHDATGHVSERSPYVNVTTTGKQQASGCTVSYGSDSWGDGFSGTMWITNTGTATWDGWELKFTFPGDQKITQGWSATWSQSGATVTARNLDWNGYLEPGDSVDLGFTGSYRESNEDPVAFTINGSVCTVD